MSRPITLFTGQWADLPFEEFAKLASGWGYDGLEIACWGDHLDPWQAAESDAYVRGKLDLLEKYNLKVYAISNHLKGQAVCDDPIDGRHQAMLSARVWGDGDPEGVRQRAAEEMKLTAPTAQRLGVETVIGFTGSAIWKYVAMFPPRPPEQVRRRLRDFAGPVAPDPRRLRRVRRPVRPRGAPLRDRLRLLDHRGHPGGDRPPDRRSA
jgi:sugar phosphate isomerase/epimerase